MYYCAMGKYIVSLLILIVLVTGALLFTRDEQMGAAQKTVKLFYYNPALDQGPGGVQCSEQGLVSVEREIASSNTILEIRDAMQLLIAGNVRDAERGAGVTTEFPLEGFQIKEASLENGVLTLTFDDPLNKTGGGSCRVSILRAQIEATAKQFSDVKQIVILPEEIFQP